ncbi:hypothetical protein KGF86_00900 [Ornithinibacillus massiliensis]|uniref:Uncharacterized protein n=1 Tax=Ornithinibacillus massiliensis TaxID=1944633 RepID=A0ABS5M8Y2_9BACI|nr:hypothetical protein [Ornithinibacillus massiliensis]MBS3678765.1 hypothetical protein [Ornithinibacillus massiliensis]
MIMQLVQRGLNKTPMNVPSKFYHQDSRLNINLQLSPEEASFINEAIKNNIRNTAYSLPVPTNWR